MPTFSAKSQSVFLLHSGNTMPPAFLPVVCLTIGVTYTFVVPLETSIRSHFKKVYVAFVGAAIEKAMAEEIFNQLQNGTLDYAANMTNGNQLAAFCGWLVDQ